MELNIITLSKMSQIQMNSVFFISYAELRSKKT
jgi:hypothetical protein